MTDTDLDRSYTALCHALSDVGEGQAQLLLSMVCLGLMARSPDAAGVLPLIARARERCLEEPRHGD
ncbi:MAG: hypothetical protein EOO24_15990 [Comamonadaceae bacterium]|nr:MAG: hypothetical protein EOO24_15990 [Comamonadaceae bacterium]